MKFGLILNTQFTAGEDARVKVRELVDQVRAARDNGFHSVAVSHHYLLTPFQMVQPLPLLGRLRRRIDSAQRRLRAGLPWRRRGLVLGEGDPPHHCRGEQQPCRGSHSHYFLGQTTP